MSFELHLFSPLSHKKFTLIKKITTVGPDTDCDISFPGLMPFSVVQGLNSFRCIPLEKDSAKKITGPWNEDISQTAAFQAGPVTLVFFKGQDQQNPEAQYKDWDFSKLPQEIQAVDYPEKILTFLISAMQIDLGGLYLQTGSMIKPLAEVQLKLDSLTEKHLFEKHLLEMSGPFLYFNQDNHTTFFGKASEFNRFCLLRTQFSESEFIIAYFPVGKGDKLPVGVLQTLYYFLGHSLTVHLLMQRHQNARRFFKLTNEEGMYWGKTEEMRRLKTLVDRVASSDLSVLIHGETGTGKEVLVQYIKEKSQKKKIVSVNCAAIPESLLESYLFGHKKGAFTGATQDQIGKIQEAHEGILFLDEIGELPLILQSKLLRSLQEKSITPIGGKEIKVNFRLLSATHKDLRASIKNNLFREDIFYRINEVELTLPPLRSRGSDIEVLANQFLHEVLENNNLNPKRFSPQLLEAFKNYSWPGNIRELKSAIRRLALLSDDNVIQPHHWSGYSSPSADLTLETAKNNFIKNYVHKVLEQTVGNKAQAAELLGISTRTLFRILEDESSAKSGSDNDKFVTTQFLTPQYPSGTNWHNGCDESGL